MQVKPSDRLIHWAGMARAPISGTFELSPMCNFSCRICYVRRTASEVAALGGLQPASRWLSWAREAREAGMLWLLLTGGEPFLYPDFLSLYEELASMGFLISINSNGALIDERAVRVLKRAVPKRINITLYGASEESYARLCGDPSGFQRVMENICRLRENGIPYKFNCSLGRENCHELPQMIAIAQEHHVPIDVASYMFPPSRRGVKSPTEDFRLSAEQAGFYAAEAMRLQLPKDELRIYAERMQNVETPPETMGETREMACRAGRCSFWVNWQGELSACGMLDQPTVSLLQTPFSEAWAQIVAETNQTRCLAGCGGCPNYELCHPCIAAAYCETGDVNARPEYKCKMLLAEAAACKKLLKELQCGGH